MSSNASPSSGRALTSLVCGAVSLFVVIVFFAGIKFVGAAIALAGVIVGLVTLREHAAGRGLAIAGVALGGLAIAWFALWALMQ